LHHLVVISDDALEAATDLSLKHLPDRKQPDRSIDLLDEACARVRFGEMQEPHEDLRVLRAQLQDLLAQERSIIAEVLTLAAAKGTPLERFSFGTFKMIEEMGRGVEKFLTGQTTPRRPLPVPDSVRRMQQRDPAGRLSRIHCERLLLQDRFRDAVSRDGLTITADHIQSTVGAAA
jgi:ATP-dependent Clp protease ATP-binding subunit ClpA